MIRECSLYIPEMPREWRETFDKHATITLSRSPCPVSDVIAALIEAEDALAAEGYPSITVSFAGNWDSDEITVTGQRQKTPEEIAAWDEREADAKSGRVRYGKPELTDEMKAKYRAAIAAERETRGH